MTEELLDVGTKFKKFPDFKKIFDRYKQETKTKTFTRNSGFLKYKNSEGLMVRHDTLVYKNLHYMCSPYGGDPRYRGNQIRKKGI